MRRIASLCLAVLFLAPPAAAEDLQAGTERIETRNIFLGTQYLYRGERLTHPEMAELLSAVPEGENRYRGNAAAKNLGVILQIPGYIIMSYPLGQIIAGHSKPDYVILGLGAFLSVTGMIVATCGHAGVQKAVDAFNAQRFPSETAAAGGDTGARPGAPPHSDAAAPVAPPSALPACDVVMNAAVLSSSRAWAEELAAGTAELAIAPKASESAEPDFQRRVAIKLKRVLSHEDRVAAFTADPDGADYVLWAADSACGTNGAENPMPEGFDAKIKHRVAAYAERGFACGLVLFVTEGKGREAAGPSAVRWTGEIFARGDEDVSLASCLDWLVIGAGTLFGRDTLRERIVRMGPEDNTALRRVLNRP